ncbi:MAG: DNA gyrase inhibitor YacG [Nitrospirota bacterium]
MVICPICKDQTTREENPQFPFCGKRCKEIDLGLWVMEAYRVPARPEEMDSKQKD